MKDQIGKLLPIPNIMNDGWNGYHHFKDTTRLTINDLVFPSKNCFIPSKDKVVPRKGKTILGQYASLSNVDIGYGDFGMKEKTTGSIEQLVSNNEASVNTTSSENSSAKIDDTHVIHFFENTNKQGTVEVVGIDTDGVSFTRLSQLVFEYNNVTNNKYFSCCKLSESSNYAYFACFWRGKDDDEVLHGYCQIFSVNLNNYSVLALGVKQIYSSDVSTSYNSSAKIDDTHVINFYTIGTNSYSVVISVDGSFSITVDSPSSFIVGPANFNSCKFIDSTHIINSWSDTEFKAQVFSINLSTYVVTPISTPTVIGSYGLNSNSLDVIDLTHFVNFWQKSSDSTNNCQIFEVNTGTGAITPMDSPLNFDTPNTATYNSCSLIDSTHVVNSWGTSTLSKSQIFKLNTTTGVIKALGISTKANPNSGIYNACTYMGNNKVINFSSTLALLFEIEIYITGITLSMPCPGKNRVLLASILTKNTGNGDKITSVKYNNVEMTQAFKIALDSDNERYFYYLVNPTVNYNNLVIESDSIDESLIVSATSYYNVIQTVPTILSSEGPTIETSIEISEIPTVDKSWIVGFFCGGDGYDGGLTEGENTIFRGGNKNFQMADSGVIEDAGETTMSAIFDSSTSAIAFAAVLAPAGGTPTREDWYIIGHKERYTNDGGITMEVRVTRTDDPSLRDIIEVLLRNPVTNKYEWYQVTENANPLEQGNAPRYYMDEFFNTNLLQAINRRNNKLVWVNGTRNIFTWSGGVNNITEITNDIYIKGEIGKSWVSKGFSLIPGLTVASQGQETKYIIVNGRKYKIEENGYDLGLIDIVDEFQDGETITGGTSGATAKIATVFGKSLLVYDTSGTFEAKETITGGTSGATAKIATVFKSTGIETDTIFISNTNDINVNDIALARITPPNSDEVYEQDVITLDDSYPNIDFCRQNKNYMFYGSFNSKQLFMSNNFNRTAIEELKDNSSVGNYGILILPATPDFTGSTKMIFTVTITDGGTDLGYYNFSWNYTYGGVIFNGGSNVRITKNSQITLNTPYGYLSIIFTSDAYGLGDSWTITASPAIGDAQYKGDVTTPPAWANFYYDLPRVPGQGYVWNLPATFYTMSPQEDNMYVGDKYGKWGYIETILGEDLASEKINWVPLKQTAASKPIFPYMIGYMENYIVYVTENKTLDFIGRKEFLELPQIDYLSQDIAYDFEDCSFEQGSIEYLNKMLYITSPKNNKMLVYDNRNGNKFWQPPQEYIENAILSIVDNLLISHSNILNQTFTLFNGKDDAGAEYQVIMRTGFSTGDLGRWKNKYTNNTFLEGYVEGNPKLIGTVLRAPNDPTGISHVVQPVITDLNPDTSPLGRSDLGFHSLGGDKSNDGRYFQEIYEKYAPILNYYFIAFQVACTSKSHTYSILSVGANMASAPTGNNNLVGDKTID